MMQRNKHAKLGDRVTCWYLRTMTIGILSVVGLSVWIAVQGNSGTLNQTALLLMIGSVVPYLTQALADACGAFSRVGLLNWIVYLYSLMWLPTIGVFVLTRLWVGEFTEASSAILVGCIFWLIRYSTRLSRMQREQGEHPV